MNNTPLLTFDRDIYPGRPKILFIGNPTSAHVQGWINLLKNHSFNIRLFSSAEGYPPGEWPVKVYLTTKYPPQSLDHHWRRSWFPIPEEWFEHNERVRQAVEDEKKREDLIRQDLEWGIAVQAVELQYQQAVASFIEAYQQWKAAYAGYQDEVKQLLTACNQSEPWANHGRVVEQYHQLVVITTQLLDDYNAHRWPEKPLWRDKFTQLYRKVFSARKNRHDPPNDLNRAFQEIAKELNDRLSELEKMLGSLPNTHQFLDRLPPEIPIKGSVPARPPTAPPSYFPIDLPVPKAATPQAWLAEIIQAWQPDIIHTFGLDTGSEFYYQARKEYHLEEYGKWVLKVFGGSDLAFSLYDPPSREKIAAMFSEASQILFDNTYYIRLAAEMGILQTSKVCPLSPVPGSGGINVDHYAKKWAGPTSSRRVIVWPKSYETTWSKAIPVLLALRNVLEQIQPCEVYMLTANSEVRSWFLTFPDEMKRHFHLFEGVSREQVLDIMLTSRVMLAPSLIDGVPNSMYEAMACGALPIVSPLETIRAVVSEENVLFVNNLDQTSIEQAIVRAMQDDRLVDECARRNVALVKELADEEKIKIRAISYYEDLYQQKVS